MRQKRGRNLPWSMRGVLALGFAFAACAGPLTVAGAASPCPNEAIRVEQGMTALPDCMALEMVSPPKKFNQEVSELRAFSLDGTRALFTSKAALAETSGLQAFGGDRYVASRLIGGWSPASTSPPAAAEILEGGEGNFGGPFAFSSDLARWTLIGAGLPETMVGEGRIFADGLDNSLSPLSPQLVALDDVSGSETVSLLETTRYLGAAADMRTVVFGPKLPTTAFLPGDPRAGTSVGHEAPETNSYVASLTAGGQPTLQLLARDRQGVVFGGRCGSQLGIGTAFNGGRTQGAISADGSRIYFSTRPAQPEGVECSQANPLRIFRRTETPAGPEIDELLPGEDSAPGNDTYQGASLDGSKVFFLSSRSLSLSDQDTTSEACGSSVGGSKGCDLYLYDSSRPPAERLLQISAGGNGDATPGKGANVLSGIPAIAPDGSRAYFVAQGILTTDPNPQGAVAVTGQPNLYVWEERDAAHPSGHLAFIGTLAAADAGRLWGIAQSFGGGAYAVPLLSPAERSGGGNDEEGGDGRVLAFVTAASLTADDADAGRTDVYRYDSAAGTLTCVSCAGAGPDAAPFDAAAGTRSGSPTEAPSSEFAELGRWVSEDGETIAFATPEPLAPSDDDGEGNPYVWKQGELARLPGKLTLNEHGNLQFPSQLPVVSVDGGEVGFTTEGGLLAADRDTARDAYVARVEGGFPPIPPAPPACDSLSESSCRGPVEAGNGIAVDSSKAGPGNPAAAVVRRSCRKGRMRRGKACVKAKRHPGYRRHPRNKRNGGAR